MPPLLAAVPVLALAAVPAAQVTPLVLEGDPVPGVGSVVDVLDVVVHDGGGWMARVRTDFPSSAADEVVLRNGAVYLREGDPLAGPPGAVAAGLGQIGWNDLGETAWVLGSPATSQGGVYFETTPVALPGDVCGAPGLSPGTPYFDAYACEINAARAILASVQVKDPAIPGSADSALVLLQVDATGTLLSETVLAKKLDPLPGFPESAMWLFPWDDAGLGLGDGGDAIYGVETGDGRDAVLLNGSPIAVVGEPALAFGHVWGELAGSRVDVGGGGDHVFTGVVSGPTVGGATMVWNGLAFVREGETLPSFAPHALEPEGSLRLGGAPVLMTDAGQVLWYGDWDDPDTTRDSGFFRDHELFLQEGVSFAAGQRIDTLGEPGFDFDASDDGGSLIFVARLADGRKGAFLLDVLHAVIPYSGCAPNASTLESSAALLGKRLAFQLYDAQAPDADGFVALATAAPPGYPPCGLPLGTAGELLVDVAPPNPILVLGPAPAIPLGTTVAFLSSPIPADLSLIGVELFAQGLFVDAAGLAPGEPLRLSNGLELAIGLP